MGRWFTKAANDQSTSDVRGQNRLSKPRTYTGGLPSSVQNPSKKDLRLSTSRLALSDVADEGMTVDSTPGAQRGKPELRESVRSDLYAPEEEEEDVDESSFGVLAVSLKDRFSRSGSKSPQSPSAKSSASQLKSASQLSVATTSEPRVVDLETAVAILQELRKTASPEDLIALHRALLPTRPAEPVSSASEPLVGSSAAALIRRRSLAMPGLATRIDDKRTSVVKEEPAEEEDHVWKREMICASPLTRLSSLDAAGVPSVKEAPRAETPGDLDYAQLGSMQLGSLVITNGMESPAPSVVSRAKTPTQSRSHFKHDEEYFTASEGDGTSSHRHPSDEYGPPLPQRAPPPPPDQSNVIAERESRPQQRGWNGPKASRTRDGSPLKQEMRAHSLAPDSPDEGIRVRKQRQPLPAHNSTSMISWKPQTGFDNAFDLTSLSEPVDNAPNASTLASEYLAELPRSPFAPLPAQPQESAEFDGYKRTKSEPQIDEGYYDATPDAEQQSQSFSPTEASSVAATLPRLHLDGALTSHPPTKLTSRPAVHIKRPVQHKSDSGYSSGASVYNNETPSAYRKESVPEIQSTFEAFKRASVDNFKQSTLAAATTNPKSSGRIPTTKPVAEVSNSDVVCPSTEQQERSKMERSKSWKKSMRKSWHLLSSESTTSLAAQPAQASSGTQLGPKKLQKRRPLSQQLLSLRDPHEMDSVPRVPSSVFSRFAERMADRPDMEHLNRTYDDVSERRRREPSEEPVEDVFDNQYRFPDAEDEYTAMQRNRFSQADIERPPPTPPHRFGILRPSSMLKLNRRKSRVNERGEIPGVTDLGDVAYQLGASPYDVAVHNKGAEPLAAPPTHAYQMSSNQPRSGPTAGMDDRTASKFAQMRSQQRAALRQAMENETPHSVLPRSNSDLDGIPSMDSTRRPPAMRRPKSMYGNFTESTHPTSQPRPRPRSIGPGQDGFARRPIPPQQPLPLPRSADVEYDLPYQRRIDNVSPTTNHNADYISKPAKFPSPAQQSAPSQRPLDWSAQADKWRQRKLHAQTTVHTTSSAGPASNTISTTTTTVITTATSTLPAAAPKRPNPFARRPAQQSAPATTTIATTKPSAIGTAALQAKRSTGPTADDPAFAEEGLFGRYGGGLRYARIGLAGKRDVSNRTDAMRGTLGVDLGDIPSFG